MQSGPHLTASLTTGQGLRFAHYLALLPAGALDLEAAVTSAVAGNPVLERTPGRHCPWCGLYGAPGPCAACATTARSDEVAAPVDWRAELLLEARIELPASLHTLLGELVDTLDDHGFLPEPPDADPADVARVVAGLRAVGPPGVASRSALDCVRVQALDLVAGGEAPALLVPVATRWLEAVAEGRYADIARAEGTTEAAVLAAVAVLRARTRPFVALAGAGPRARPTDVVFGGSGDGPLRVHVAGPAALGLRRVDDPLPADPEARRWWAPYRTEAGRLLAAVEARATMLARVAESLAVHQEGYIRHGPAHHVPLRRSELARELDVHPSTVGRAVAHKVARCPDGRLVDLARFFGGTTSLAERVRAALEEGTGTTDADIAARMTAAGVPIARRTVAKYRALLANPGSPRR